MSLVKDAEFLSAEELRIHQETCWSKQVTYVAENSSFYQKLWEGITPPLDLSDLHRLPFSDKVGLRDSQADFPPYGDYLASGRDKVNRHHRTSGTTGQAMNLALSALDCHITEVVGGRSQSSAGLSSKNTVVHCLNYQMWMGGVTDHMTLEATGATVVPYGVGGTEKLIETILSVGVDAISCTPSYPAVLEKVIAEKFPHLTPKDLGLKLGMFGGEAGLDDPAFRERFRRIWGMEPRNANYGVSDVFSNFGAQCEHDTSLHFMAADVLYPELIDPETEALLPIEAGQRGELVLTHLARECQPLVRFKTGDIIEIVATESCSCERKGFRFKVVGRSDDMIVVRGLNMFPTMVASVIGLFAELSGDYRINLDHTPPYDHLPISAELAKGVDLNPEEIKDLTSKIEEMMKSKLGATAKVEILPSGTFPITEGKTKRVVRSYE